LNTVAHVAGATPPATVVDAAIGTITADRTDQIRQLGVPAIYEMQAPALGMNVQKRGRTTRLTTNGRITTINTTLNITYRNRTRLGRSQNAFIITSTNGNQFSAAGDSGSLILNQARGELEGAFPVVGLLFAGGTDAAGTPITIANNINAVFGALNLATVCACVARAVFRAVFAGAEAEAAASAAPAFFRGDTHLLLHKERQYRSLYDRLGKTGGFGAGLDRLIRSEAARVGEVVTQDDEAFGLLVRALRPFGKQPTSFDILETRLDRETVENLLKFAARVAQRSPRLRAKLAFAKVVAKSIEGAKLGHVLRSAKLGI